MKNIKNRFVVQEHHARNLHWDFRLQMKGVLKSWAVPKGVPEEESVKRLAVQVEDHELDYIDFEGVIPDGEYGAGEVKIWDRGTFSLDSESPKRMIFTLKGRRLKGRYSLIHLKEKEWLLIKMKPSSD